MYEKYDQSPPAHTTYNTMDGSHDTPVRTRSFLSFLPLRERLSMPETTLALLSFANQRRIMRVSSLSRSATPGRMPLCDTTRCHLHGLVKNRHAYSSVYTESWTEHAGVGKDRWSRENARVINRLRLDLLRLYYARGQPDTTEHAGRRERVRTWVCEGDLHTRKERKQPTKNIHGTFEFWSQFYRCIYRLEIWPG